MIKNNKALDDIIERCWHQDPQYNNSNLLFYDCRQRPSFCDILQEWGPLVANLEQQMESETSSRVYQQVQAPTGIVTLVFTGSCFFLHRTNYFPQIFKVLQRYGNGMQQL